VPVAYTSIIFPRVGQGLFLLPDGGKGFRVISFHLTLRKAELSARNIACLDEQSL
jgi:hypothetical protein